MTLSIPHIVWPSVAHQRSVQRDWDNRRLKPGTGASKHRTLVVCAGVFSGLRACPRSGKLMRVHRTLVLSVDMRRATAVPLFPTNWVDPDRSSDIGVIRSTRRHQCAVRRTPRWMNWRSCCARTTAAKSPVVDSIDRRVSFIVTNLQLHEVRLQLSVLAYNLGNLWRRLVLPKWIDSWSVTSLQQRASGQTRALLLAPADGESSDPLPVRVLAPADLGAAGAGRLTGEICRRPSGRREGARRVRCPQTCWGRRASARRNSGRVAFIAMRDPRGKEFRSERDHQV
jgi:hypothetical protein